MRRTARWTLGLGVLGAFVWSAWATEVSASRVVEGLPFMLDFIRRIVPPDLSVMGHALHVLRWGVLPQLVPQFLSFALYRFETNIRAAAVLGFVGAGGIGFYIQTYLRMLNYPAASAVLLVLVGLVMLVDFTSSKLRARLI